MEVTKDELKTFLVCYHGLQERTEDPLTYFRKVGSIQYDPLNIVGRNPDLVLQSRISNYSKVMLDELLYTRYALIDGWDKMMSIYPMSDWVYFRRIRDLRQKDMMHTYKMRDSLETLRYVDEVYALIKEGPKTSRDFQVGDSNHQVWGHKKEVSVALDYLYTSSKLGIKNKHNTMKRYDLIENIVPKHLLKQEDPFIDDEAFLDWYIERRIGSLGAIWNKNGSGWINYFFDKVKARSEGLKRLIQSGRITEITVLGMKEKIYVRTSDLKYFKQRIARKSIRFIAPLDNLMWDRKFILEVFGFDYVWEVYKPASQRTYGYYVLPILYGSDLIGRIEFENHRPLEELVIKNIWWEEGVDPEEIKDDLHAELEEFCRFLNAPSYKGKGM